MSSIKPYLWFESQAEEAMNYYVSIFPDSEVITASRMPEGGPGPAGALLVGHFRINGQEVMVLNGGPEHRLTEAFSFLIECRDQAEVDTYWEKLLAGGGEPGPCGWLKDRFGLSWQVVPTVLGELLQDEDPAKAGRVMQAMLQMSKLDIAALEAAYAGEEIPVVV